MSGIHGGAENESNRGISEQMESAEKIACALSEAIDQLFQRLIPVTINIPAPPAPNIKEGPSPTRCDLAQKLCALRDKLNRLHEQVARQKEMLDI